MQFDYKPTVLTTFIDRLEAPVVSCNLDVSQEPHLVGKVKRYIIKELPISGIKVAIVGLTTKTAVVTSRPGVLPKHPLIECPKHLMLDLASHA